MADRCVHVHVVCVLTPAANARPSPVMMMAPITPLSSYSATALARSVTSRSFRAFSASGRFSQIRPTRPGAHPERKETE